MSGLSAKGSQGGPAPALTVGITGASGLVGRALTARLTAAGVRTVAFVRREVRDPIREIAWDPAAGRLAVADVKRLDALVHLAGEPIGEGRWTAARKRLMQDSRVEGTRLVARTLAALAGEDSRPRVLVQASAIGLYGTSDGQDGSPALDESAPVGRGFLAELCEAWEAATAGVEAAGHRLAIARIGIALSPHGGALARMLPPFRAGLGGPLGSGRQVLSWIHLDDVASALDFLLRTPVSGAFNLTAPTPVTQRDFARALGRALHRPAVLPAPAAVLRLALGEMADQLVLGGARVLPTRLQAAGFRHEYPNLDAALAACLNVS